MSTADMGRKQALELSPFKHPSIRKTDPSPCDEHGPRPTLGAAGRYVALGVFAPSC